MMSRGRVREVVAQANERWPFFKMKTGIDPRLDVLAGDAAEVRIVSFPQLVNVLKGEISLWSAGPPPVTIMSTRHLSTCAGCT